MVNTLTPLKTIFETLNRYMDRLKIRSLFLFFVAFDGTLPSLTQDLFMIADLEISEKYDKRVRPLEHGPPVNVETQIFVISLGPIDAQTFTFEIGYYHRQWWNDPRLRFNTTLNTDITMNMSPEAFIWTPDPTLVNGKKLEKYPASVRAVLSPNGNIYFNKRMKATAVCPMNLKYYPMDTQHCPFILESYAFTNKDMQLSWNENPVLYDKETLQISGYDLKSMNVRRYLYPLLVGNVTEYYDNLKIDFIVERSFLYFFYRAYIPTMLLMIFNMASYWISDNDVPARVTLIMTTFLSSILILQSVTEQTVKVSYTTPLQLFLVVNVLLIVTAVIEYLFLLHLRLQEEVDENCQDMKEATCTSTLPSKQEQSSNNKKSRQRSMAVKTNVHKIDRLFRVGVPLLYLAFCCTYFAYYMTVLS